MRQRIGFVLRGQTLEGGYKSRGRVLVVYDRPDAFAVSPFALLSPWALPQTANG